MSNANPLLPTGNGESYYSDYGAVVGHILTPGSSLDPKFIMILDGVLGTLALLLTALLWTTGGNLHFLALLSLELALWMTIKWFVWELRKIPSISEKKPKNE